MKPIVGASLAASNLIQVRRFRIGIRIAIGAGRRQTIFMILRQRLTLASIGVAAGLVMRSQLAKVSLSKRYRP